MASVETVRRPGRTAPKFGDPRVVCGVVTEIIDGEEDLWDAVRLNNRTYNKAVELNREEKRCLELLYRRHCPRLRQITGLVRRRDGSGKWHKRPWTLIPTCPEFLGDVARLEGRQLSEQQQRAEKKKLSSRFWKEVKQLKQDTRTLDAFERERKTLIAAKRQAGKSFKARMQIEGLHFVSKDETWKEAQRRKVDGKSIVPLRFRSLRERRGSLSVERKRNNARGSVDRPTWGEVLCGDWDHFKVEEVRYERHVNSHNNLRRLFQIRFLLNAKKRRYVTIKAVFWKLPPGSVKIAMAKLTRCNEGIGWGVRLTVEPSAELAGEEKAFFTKPVVGERTAACDFGWRRMPDGSLRVAVFVGEDGRCVQLVLPESYVRQWDIAAQKQKSIDREFDGLRDWLDSKQNLPAEFRHWRQFKHARRFARAFREWRETNPPDDALYKKLKDWHHKFQHDQRHADGRRDNLIAGRNHYYKTFARKLTDTYRTLLLDTIGGQKLAQRPAVDAPLTDFQRAGLNESRAQRQIAGYSVLKLALKQCGLTVEEPDCHYTSRDCAFCQHRNQQSSDLDVVCAHCLRPDDRDVRACKNMLNKFGTNAGEFGKMETFVAKTRGIHRRKANRQVKLGTNRL